MIVDDLRALYFEKDDEGRKELDDKANALRNAALLIVVEMEDAAPTPEILNMPLSSIVRLVKQLDTFAAEYKACQGDTS